MGNALLLTAVKDHQAVALADAILPFDNLRLREIEAFWRAFYDSATSFALSKTQLRVICCRAVVSGVSSLHGSNARITEYADGAFDLFTDSLMQRRWQQGQPGARGLQSQQYQSPSDSMAAIDALEFLSAIAFIAAIPLDEKIDLLFDSWDMSEDGALDLDEFTISLKSTISGLAKIIQPTSNSNATTSDTAVDEEEIIMLAESIFREIANCGASSSKEKGFEESTTITCEQFREFCMKNKRAKELLDLFDVADSSPEKLVDIPMDTIQDDVGDMFLAVKPWIGAIVPPTKIPPLSKGAPLVSVKLDWIFGYSAQDCKNNVRFAATTANAKAGRFEEIVYPAAAACVVLNTKTMTQRHHLSHTDDILSLCLHPRLPLAASGEIGKQPKIIVWNLETMDDQCIVQGFHKRGILQLAFLSPEMLVSIGGDDDHSIAVYESSNNWKSAALKIAVKGNKAAPFHITTNPRVSSEFVTCGQKYVEFWSLQGKELVSKKGLLGKKGSLQPFPVAQYLETTDRAVVVGTSDGCLYLFAGRQLTNVVKAHEGAITALYYASGLLLSGGRDGQIIQWDDKLKQVGSPAQIQNSLESAVLPQRKGIRSCCYSPDRRAILVGTLASEIYELDAKTGQNIHSEPLTKGHFQGELWGVDTHPTKQQCCTVGDDQTLRVWDLAEKFELGFLELPIPGRACAYSGDGKLIAVGLGTEGSGKTGNPAANAKKQQPNGGFVVYSATDLSCAKEPCFDAKRWVSDVKFSPDNRTLSVASHDSKIYLYNVLKGFSRTHVFNKHSSYITHMDFSLDGNYLQSTSGGYELLFTEVKTGKHVTNATTFRDEIWHTMTSTLGWSVQGIWEAESDGTDVNAVDRSNNGKLLATGDDFGKVKVFQYPCALEKSSSLELRGHASHVTGVRWSSGDRYIVSVGGNDRRADDPLEVAATNDDIGDEFMAVRPWLGAVVAPTKAASMKVDSTSPNTRLELERVHGYQAQTASNNARYDSNGKVVYHTAALGIVFDKAAQRQSFFRSHDDDVAALCAHPNGTTFATSQMGKKPKIYVWDSASGVAVAPCLEGFHQRFVNAICYSSDGSKLGSVGGDDDHSIAIYNWQSGVLSSQSRGERNNVRGMCYHAATKEWVTCGDKHIRFWTEQGKNLTSKKAIFGTKAYQSGKVPSAFDCVVSFGQMVVAGGSTGHLVVFQSSVEVTKTVQAHESAVLALYATKRELISGGKDSKIAVWDAQFNKVASFDMKECTLQGSKLLNSEIRSVCSSRVSPRLFLVGTGGSDLVEFDAGRAQPTLSTITRGHCRVEVWGLACHPVKPEYCTVGDDQTIRVWCLVKKTQLRIQRLECVARACALTDPADIVAIGFGGRNAINGLSKAAQAKIGGIVLLCYTDLTKKVFEDRPSKQAISEMKFSPTGSVLAVGSHDHKIYLYRLDRNATKVVKAAVFDKHQSYITHLDFSVDGQVLQSNCGAYELLFSNAHTGKHITSASSTKNTPWHSWTCVLGWPVQGIWPPCSDGTDVNAVSRNSRENLLVTSDDFGIVKLYRYPCVAKNASSVDHRGHSSHVTNVRWSHDDSYVVSIGGNDRSVMEWREESFDDSAGDEFMAVKPWIGAIVAPTNAATPNSREPDLKVELEWVYGYQSELSKQNLVYNTHDEIVYHTAAVGIIYDSTNHLQRHHIGHNDDIISFALCDTKRNLIATGERGKKPALRVWDAHTGELRCEMKEFHSRGIMSLAFSSDSTRLVSVGDDDDHSLAVWSDASNGSWTLTKLLATGKGDKAVNRFASFGVNGDTIVTGGVKHVLFWSVQGKTIVSKKGIVGKKGTLQTFPTGCNFGGDFVTGTAGGELYVWRGNGLSRTVKAHEGEVRVVASTLQSDNSTGTSAVLLSGGKDGRVVMWNSAYQSLKCFDLGAMHVGSFGKVINSVFLSATGRKLLVGTCSSDIIEIDVVSGGALNGGQPLFSGHFTMELWGLAVHPSQREFVTVGDDRTLRVWDMEAKRLIQAHLLPAKARACAYSPDSELLAVGFGGDNGVRQRRKPASKQGQQSREGGFAVLRASDLDMETFVFEDKPAKEWISDVKFSPNGDLLALGSHDNSIHLYSVGSVASDFKKRKPFSKHNSYITHFDFSQDSSYIQSNCGAYEYLFCDTASSSQISRASSVRDVKWATWTCTLGWPVQGIWPECADGTDINAVCASASRTILASGDDSGNVKFFRYPCIPKGSKFIVCRGHSSHVANVRFSFDDKYLISVGGNDRSIFQWKLA
ncbi:microtubule-associated protein, putative [Phytophthora infestans T30-4]|uniref:Microtubule-associated protein, putative n=1 Tax=Phytophthora infestans (strain T30-4) TaxID=403677 RepID=D0MWG7_PHYIT|nr:microtubule-associated protein, putative [Phytophthora infestans T30-4]EEY63980.1 microtubule-associated protein, putative [Phytophthora infestans T30-4]|eukprot:XP_002907416.1 microtubule-associated protein, putative [Phytophthora infestans T30-4]